MGFNLAFKGLIEIPVFAEKSDLSLPAFNRPFYFVAAVAQWLRWFDPSWYQWIFH